MPISLFSCATQCSALCHSVIRGVYGEIQCAYFTHFVIFVVSGVIFRAVIQGLSRFSLLAELSAHLPSCVRCTYLFNIVIITVLCCHYSTA